MAIILIAPQNKIVKNLQNNTTMIIMTNRINIIYRLSLVLFYYAIVLALTSCQTERKATRFMSEHPNVLAKLCDEKFPVIPSVDTFVTVDSLLLQQYEKEFGNLYYLIDSLISNDSIKTVIQTQIKTVSKPIYKTKTIRIKEESTAKLKLCKGQIEALQELITERERDYELNIQGFQNELDERDQTILKQQGKLDKWKRWAIRFFILLLLSLGWNFRRLIGKILI